MKILVCSLEPSSSLHFKEILKYTKDCEFVGIFDKSLGNSLYDSKDFSVMGITDVLKKYFFAKEVMRQMLFLAKDCDKILLIDAPAFNLPFAKMLKNSYPTKEIIYYILPKVWAWKKNRVKLIEKYCDKAISIFPFEDKFFKNSQYFGNPLCDEINIKKEKISDDIKTIAYLAGSRKSEIQLLMPIIDKLSKNLKKKSILIIPPYFTDNEIRNYYGNIDNFEIIRDTQEGLNRSDFAFICSGTATLEATIIGIPFILIYKAKKLDYFIGKQFVKLEYVGLANIIFNFLNKKPIHPELIQDNLTINNLLYEYNNYNKDKFFDNILELRDILKSGASKEVARFLCNLKKL
jgi:lipid-A-disaccharide synthase